MAALHPNAHYTAELTRDAYSASGPIADPLRLFDCAPVSDGGGAVLITSKERARDIHRRPVQVLSTGFSTGHMHLSCAESLTAFRAGHALDHALEAAGLDRSAIDIALVYDCFTIAMLVNLEDFGFVGKGEAGAAFEAGRFTRGGDLPVNTHGGLLCRFETTVDPDACVAVFAPD